MFNLELVLFSLELCCGERLSATSVSIVSLVSSSALNSPRVIAMGIRCSILSVIGVANEVTGERVLTVVSFEHRVVGPGVISVVLVGFGSVAFGAVGVLTGWKVYLSMVENSL